MSAIGYQLPPRDGTLLDLMSDGLACRAMDVPPRGEAAGYFNVTLRQAAHACLVYRNTDRGVDPVKNPGRVFELALTESDFPLLLANTLNKILLSSYESAQSNYRLLAKQRSFRDFKPHSVLRAGDFPVPLSANENGEFKYGTMSESGETVTVASFGRVVSLTRKVLINDNLQALADLGTAAGIRASDFENAHFFTTCILAGSGIGPTLADGDPVFDANHANVVGAGALDATRLSAARALLMNQTTADGLNLQAPASVLLVAPSELQAAETLLSATALGSDSKLRAIADASLTGTRFYLFAAPSQLPNYVYGRLEGAAGPLIQSRAGFAIDGVEVKLTVDLGVGAVDSRGGVSGAGA